MALVYRIAVWALWRLLVQSCLTNESDCKNVAIDLRFTLRLKVVLCTQKHDRAETWQLGGGWHPVPLPPSIWNNNTSLLSNNYCRKLFTLLFSQGRITNNIALYINYIVQRLWAFRHNVVLIPTLVQDDFICATPPAAVWRRAGVYTRGCTKWGVWQASPSFRGKQGAPNSLEEEVARFPGAKKENFSREAEGRRLARLG